MVNENCVKVSEGKTNPPDFVQVGGSSQTLNQVEPEAAESELAGEAGDI